MVPAKKLIFCLGVILLFIATYSDVTTRLIPNLLVAGVALLGIIRLIVTRDIKLALYTGGVSFLVFTVGSVIFAHGFVGGGDVKLTTATVLLIGYRDSIRFFLLLIVCIVAQCAVWYVIAGAALVPFGVAIAIAGNIMLLFQSMSNKASGVCRLAVFGGKCGNISGEEQPVDNLTPGSTVEANSIDSNSVGPKPNPKLGFLSKHWRGEYSLPRSFWVHGVLLGYLLLVMSCVLVEIRLHPGSPFFSMISMIGIGIWQIGGVWRSAKRRGGYWARAANGCIVGILLLFMGSFEATLTHQLRRLEIERQPASSTPPAPRLTPADNKSVANTQLWKQVAGNSALADEDAHLVKQVGNWKIVLSESLNNTCNMLAVYPDHRSLWLGFVRLKDVYGFALQIANKGWDSLISKEQYVLRFNWIMPNLGI